MRILVVSNLWPPDVMGGYELGCVQAVEALRRRGHDVLVLTTQRGTHADEAGVLRRMRLTDVYDLALMQRASAAEWSQREAQGHIVDAENVAVLGRVIDDFRPEVAYVWNLVGLGGYGIMGMLQHMQVPWVWHIMDCVPRTLATIRGHVVPGLARNAGDLLEGRWIVCSQGVADEIEDGGIELRGPVHCISNWIDGMPPTAPRRHFRGGHLRMAFAGQIGRHKGVGIIIEMATLLRSAGFANFSVDLFGSAPDTGFQDLVERRGVEDNIRFRGFKRQDELVRLYREYDVFIFPTWAREPYGFAPLEAQAYGCVPLVSADCGYSEWFVHDVHCLKADRSPEDFAEIVRAVLEMRIDLGPLAQRGEALAWREFHVDHIMKAVDDVLHDAAKAARPRAAGSAMDGYRLARLAEQLSSAFIHETAHGAVSAGA